MSTMSCFACFPTLRWASCRETSPQMQDMTPEDARFVGKYKVLETIGEGQFGIVALAEDSQTRNTVALKALLLSKVPEKDIHKEVSIHRRLCHPHIISLHDVAQNVRSICLVMEYAPGGALVEYVSQNSYCAEDEGRRMFQQLISGVEHCHCFGIAHRDIKLDNILLDKDQNAKLADFGLAEAMVNGEVYASPKGSAQYAPAELFVNGVGRYLGAPVDVYSCGVVLFCMLCGKFPFVVHSRSDGNEELIKLIKLGRFTIPKHVSSGAEMLLRRLVTTSVNQRLTIKELHQHRWFKDHLSSEPFGDSPCKGVTLLGRNANLNQSMNMKHKGGKLIQECADSAQVDGEGMRPDALEAALHL